MATINPFYILKRAKENCTRDGLQWEPAILSPVTEQPKSELAEFDRVTYLAEAHWQLFKEALKDRDALRF